MTVCLFLYMFKYYWLDLPEKQSDDGSWSNLDPINFDSHLDNHMDTHKVITIFPFTYYYMSRWRYAFCECFCLIYSRHLIPVLFVVMKAPLLKNTWP